MVHRITSVWESGGPARFSPVFTDGPVLISNADCRQHLGEFLMICRHEKKMLTTALSIIQGYKFATSCDLQESIFTKHFFAGICGFCSIYTKIAKYLFYENQVGFSAFSQICWKSLFAASCKNPYSWQFSSTDWVTVVCCIQDSTWILAICSLRIFARMDYQLLKFLLLPCLFEVLPWCLQLYLYS